MSSTLARLRPTLVTALLLAGCGGGNSSGFDLPAASSRQDASSDGSAPAAPPTPAGTPAPVGATFLNPLLASGPDPYVVGVDGVYYYTHTSGDRIGLWATAAMSRLDRASHVTIFVPPSSGANSRDLWAPELHRLDGKWYVYYAAGDGSRASYDPYPSQRMFVLENDHADPMRGTWTDRGRVLGPDADAWAIDGTVMEHGGQRYFVWSGRPPGRGGDQHLYIARMTNPWTLDGPGVRLSSPDLAWERAGRVGVNEGPQALHAPRGGVSLVYSANGCWTDDYALGMLTLREGGDPLAAADWVKSDRPVFGSDPAGGAYGPGHNSFFKSPDGTQHWLLYHANAYPGAGCGDARTPRMQRIEWRDDGTPQLGAPAPIGMALPVPAGEPPEP